MILGHLGSTTGGMMKHISRLLIISVLTGIALTTINCGDTPEGPTDPTPTASTLFLEFTGEYQLSTTDSRSISLDGDEDGEYQAQERSEDHRSSNCQVTATWTECPDEDFQSYELFRSTLPNIPGDPSAATLICTYSSFSQVFYVDNDVTWETKYYYAIRTTDTESLTSWSNEASLTTPVEGSGSTPSILSVEFTGSTDLSPDVRDYYDILNREGSRLTGDNGTCEVTASWTECPDGDFSSYTLYRSGAAGISQDTTNAVNLGTFSSSSATEYVDGSVTWETTYYFVLLTRGSGTSYAWSNEVEILTPSEGGGSSIDVTEPTSSTIWEWNETGTQVLWIPSEADSVRIELWKSSTKIDDFCGWTQNDGSYTRSEGIPSSWGVGDTYRVKVLDDLAGSGLSEEFSIEDGSSLPDGMEFVTILPGSFEMGAPEGEEGSESCERPVHTVTISYSFEMMTTEVTQGMWQEIMGSNPSHTWGVGPTYPVYYISWNDCQDYIFYMNELDPAHIYRLPSEAEWEYACRAGTTTRFYWGEDPADIQISMYAWWGGNAQGSTHPVGTLQPNTWGLYDMSGNVYEWCQDWYHGNYNGAPSDGSAWEDPTTDRVRRGGYFSSSTGSECRSAHRAHSKPDTAWPDRGFRLVRTAV